MKEYLKRIISIITLVMFAITLVPNNITNTSAN